MPKENGQYSIDDFRIPEVRVQLKENAAGALWSDTPITSSEEAAAIIGEKFLKYVDREYLILVSLSNALKPLSYNIVSSGSINATLGHPREIIKPILLANAASMMLMHSHPSGETRPSREDIALTHRISAIGDLIEIPLLDHVIVGCGEDAQPYFSFREHDMLRGDDQSLSVREPTAVYAQDPDHGAWKTDFGWVRIERASNGDFHYMDYDPDLWGREARFVTAEGSPLEVAQKVVKQLYGYSGPMEPVSRDTLLQKLREAHPERYETVHTLQQREHRHPHRR